MEISQKFVAFSEYMNFKNYSIVKDSNADLGVIF